MGFRLVVEDVCWLGDGTRPVVRGAADEGVVRRGDRLRLSGPGCTTREVTVVALGLVDATRAPLVLLAIELAPDVGPGELLPGHVLLAVQPLPQVAQAGASAVPVLIGPQLDQAVAAADAAGLQVIGPDPDGPPLDAHQGTWTVTDQRPPGGARVPRGSAVTVTLEPDGGDETGVHEPRRPRPDPGHLQAHLDGHDRSVHRR